MPSQLDLNFRKQRQGIFNRVGDLAVGLWTARDWGDESTFTTPAIRNVEGGMSATVTLINAYYNAKARAASGNAQLPAKDVEPSFFTIEDVRGVPALEVYSRPFGALGAKLAADPELEFAAADNDIADYVRKLAVTDMQLALTQSSALWIALYG